jgi:hypothetical protein
LSEALSFTQLYPLVDVTHSNVRSLSGDDIFLDSWNESYVAQFACGTTRILGSSGSQQEV